MIEFKLILITRHEWGGLSVSGYLYIAITGGNGSLASSREDLCEAGLDDGGVELRSVRTLGLGEDLARNNHRLGEDVFASQLYSQVAKSGSKALAAAKVGLITFHCTYNTTYSIVHYQI